MSSFNRVAMPFFGVLLALIAVCIVGAVLSSNEAAAGDAWCTQQGGQTLTGRIDSVICLGSDGRILPVPSDADGLWP